MGSGLRQLRPRFVRSPFSSHVADKRRCISSSRTRES